MKKAYLIVAILLIAIVGAGYYVYSKGSPEATETTTTPPEVARSTKQPDQTSLVTGEQNLPKPGTYTDYSEDNVATTTGTKILFFHAPWCPQCRELEESIRTSTIPQNTTIFKVDYDSNQALRQKYGVTLQTTFVKINDSGEKVADYVAYESPTFANVKAALLK